MEKVEFGGPEFLALMHKALLEAVATLDDSIEFSACEVFTGIPKHLDKKGNDRLVWCIRVKGGNLEMTDVETDDVALKMVADYTYMLPFVREIIGPDNFEAYMARMAEGARLGKFVQVSNGVQPPAALLEVHNKLAAITR